jgi:predicted  nucleic acid-binding Zn-ribbon protein
VEQVASDVVDTEARLSDALAQQAAALQEQHTVDLKALAEQFTATTAAIEQRTVEVEDTTTSIIDDHISTMERRIDEMDGSMRETIESKLDPLSDAFALEKEATSTKLRQLHKRLVAGEVSKATMRLACETAVRDVQTVVDDCNADVLQMESRIEPLESDSTGATSSPWSAEVLTDQLAVSEGRITHLTAEMNVLDRRVGELEQLASDGETAAYFSDGLAASK